MKKTLALLLALMMVFALCACGGSDEAEAPVAEAPVAAPAAPEAAPAEATWADYQAYLIEKAGPNAPDLAEFEGQVNALSKWEDIDLTVSPWDQLFTTVGLSTWEEFAAGNVKEPAVMGSMGGASGEPSGEPSGEAPAAGASANGAHGTASADEAGYKEYLHAWLDYEESINDNMDDTMKGEFFALIDAGNFTDFPADMLFNGMLESGSAMTFDQFVAAGGVY